MELIIFSFLAGVLTILAPCVLPVLPVIIGGSLAGHNKWRPFVVTGSLAVSIVLFTLILKSTTALIDISSETWKFISGGIILVFGLLTILPGVWEKIEVTLKLNNRSQSLLTDSHNHGGRWGAVLVGVALGPVFSSCSPTYALILATVLPQNFFFGVILLVVYAAGLSSVLLVVALFGQRAIRRMRWAADPKGWFKRILGILFILVGVAIIFGFDKQLETALIESGYFDVGSIENTLIR